MTPCKAESPTLAMAAKKELPRYSVSTIPRGYCIIFNNTNFTEQPKRCGSQEDVEVLKEVFGDLLGFDIQTYYDTTEVQMMLQLQELALKDHSKFSALVVVILSHGENGAILTTDCKVVKIHSIASYFVAKACPSLAKKPKVFFIQACQGSQASEVVAVPNTKSCISDYLPVTETDGEVEPIKQGTTPNEADFLFSFATISGKAAMRDTLRGSWYIQELVEAFKEHAKEKSVTEMLTLVAGRVAAYKFGNKTQLSPYQSTLLKELYLPPISIRKCVSVPGPDISTPKPTRPLRQYSESQACVVSRNPVLGNFWNISKCKGSPCLVLKDKSNQGNNMSTPMDVIQQGEPEMLLEKRNSTSTIESDSPQIPSKPLFPYSSNHSLNSTGSMNIAHNVHDEREFQSRKCLNAGIIAYKIPAERDSFYPNGFAIIIDNITSDRTQQVTERISHVYRTMCQMHVQKYTNLSCKGMKQLFLALSRADHSKLSCLLIMIISHGKRLKGIYDCAKKMLSIQDVSSSFSDANSPTLRGKPKIFVFETLVENSDVILSQHNTIHYPNVHNCFIIHSTVMESAKISCIERFTDALTEGGKCFVDVVAEFKRRMQSEVRVGQLIIETNVFSQKPFFFPHGLHFNSSEEEQSFALKCLQIAFNLWSNMRSNTIEALQNNMDEIVRVCNTARRVRIGSSATSIVGGIVTIVGVALIPLTLGGSAVVSAVGGAVALAGGVASITATVTEKYSSNSKLKKVQGIINVDHQLCEIIAELEKQTSNTTDETTPNYSNSDLAKSLLHGSKVLQTGVVAAKGAMAATEMTRTGGAAVVQGGVFAIRAGSIAVRGVAIAGGVVSLIILPFDIYELTTNAVKYHNRSESDAVKWLNEQLDVLCKQKEDAEMAVYQRFT